MKGMTDVSSSIIHSEKRITGMILILTVKCRFIGTYSIFVSKAENVFVYFVLFKCCLINIGQLLCPSANIMSAELFGSIREQVIIQPLSFQSIG